MGEFTGNVIKITDVFKAVDKLLKIMLLYNDRLTMEDIKELKHYRYLLNYASDD